MREGAQRIICQAVEAELGAFLEERAATSRGGPQRLPAVEGCVDGGRPGACLGSLDAGQVGRGPVFPLGAVAAVFEEGEAGGGGDSVAVPDRDIDE